MAITGQTRQAASPLAGELPYAGFQLRAVAFILDAIVLASVLFLFIAAAGLQLLLRSDWGNESNIPDEVYWASLLIVASFLLVPPWYFIAMWWARGQSLGMMAVHIAVTDTEGYHISFPQAVVRTLVWPLSFLPMGIGMLPILFDRRARALHDMLAGTVVVQLP